MKVKLLKKIRKRFQIVYYPNGIQLEEKKECMVLYDWDMDSEWSSNRLVVIQLNSLLTKEIVYDTLLKKMQERIYDCYKKYGTRRLKKQNAIVMWHKSK